MIVEIVTGNRIVQDLILVNLTRLGAASLKEILREVNRFKTCSSLQPISVVSLFDSYVPVITTVSLGFVQSFKQRAKDAERHHKNNAG